MKSAESRNAHCTVMRSNTPFFSKESDQHFFGSSSRGKSFFPSFQTRSSSIRAKLNVGHHNDPYEKEADSIADKVVQRLAEPAKGTKPQAPDTFTPFLQRKCTGCDEEKKVQKMEEEENPSAEVKKLQRKPIFESNAEPPDEGEYVQRKCEACEKDEKLQKKEYETESKNASSDIESSLSGSKGSGQPLSDNTRQQMETSLGADLSNVRIHDDSNAARMSKDLNAQAFTHGNDIYFNSGKYDTSSTAGQHLLAHELTHTVQQGSSTSKQLREKIQKKDKDTNEKTSFKKATPKELGDAADDKKGYIEKEGSRIKFHVKALKTKKYQLSSDDLKVFNDNKPAKIPKSGTRDTEQDKIWKKEVRDKARAKLKKVGKLDKDDSQDAGTLLSLKKKNQKSDKGIVGTFTQLVNEVLVPNWDYKGGPNIYQIEHMVDWQILSDKSDNIRNLILLKSEENLRVAKVVEDAITKGLEDLAKHYAKTFLDVPVSAKDIKSKYDSFIDEMDGQGNKLKETDYFYAKALTDENDEKNPFKDELITLKEESIPPEHFMLTSSDKRASYLIPYDATDFKMGAFLVSVVYNKAKGKVESISFENRLNGKVTEIGVDKNLKKKKVEVNEQKKDKYIVQDGAEKGTIGPMLKSLALTKFSPIVIEEKDIIIEGFDVSVTGKVKSTISLLDKVDISFSFDNGDFNIKAIIPLDQFTQSKKLPDPFQVEYCNLEIGGGSNTPMYIAGGIGFKIKGLGNGEVFATLGEGVMLDGKFNFDSKYFDPAEINVSYKDKEWSIGGKIGFKPGIVKGIKKGMLEVSYKAGIFTIEGDVELEIPGLKSVTLKAIFDTAGNFTFTAKVDLKQLSIIKKGELTLTVTSQDESLKVAMAGNVTPNLPKIPKLDAEFKVSYDDGLFLAEGKSNFDAKDGMISGEVKVSITNGIVADNDLKSKTEFGTSISFFGKATIKFIPFKGMEAELEVKINPKGEAQYSSDVKIHATPFKPIAPDPVHLFKFAQTIPLVGVPLLTLNFVMKLEANLYMIWVPLTVDATGSFKDKTFDELVAGKFDVPITLTLSSSAKVGIQVDIDAGASATVAVLEGGATLGGYLKLEADAKVGGTLNAAWEGEKGLKLKDGKGTADAELNLIPGLNAKMFVDLNLLISRTNLWEHNKKLAEGEKKKLFAMGVIAPFEFDEKNELKPFDPKAVKFNPGLDENTAKGEANKTSNIKDQNPEPPKGDDLVKNQVQQQVGENIRRKRANASIDMYAYAAELRAHMVKSQEQKWINYVNEAIEIEMRKIEEKDFQEFRLSIMSSKEPVAKRIAQVNDFQANHKFVNSEWFKTMRDEISAQDSSATTPVAQRKKENGEIPLGNIQNSLPTGDAPRKDNESKSGSEFNHQKPAQSNTNQPVDNVATSNKQQATTGRGGAETKAAVPAGDKTLVNSAKPADNNQNSLIVEDTSKPTEFQLKRSEFLKHFEVEVRKTFDAVLKGAGVSSVDFPFIKLVFEKYRNSSAYAIQQSLRKYEPSVSKAKTAAELLEILKLRVTNAAVQWAKSRDISAIPLFFLVESGLGPVSKENTGSTKTEAAPAIQRRQNQTGAGISQSPLAAIKSLGSGTSLEGHNRSLMERNLDADFSDVRIHTDDHAAALSESMGARAFTVGNHIAFSSNEYRPGTVIGDALIAHELEHTRQQKNAGTGSMKSGDIDGNESEFEAHNSAMKAVKSIWNRARNLGRDIRRNGMKRLKTGLSIQRCGGMSHEDKEKSIFKIADIIGQPDTYEAEIMSELKRLGDDGSEILMHVAPFEDSHGDAALYQFAGTEAGQRVLVKAMDILKDSDKWPARNRAKTIEKILAERKAGEKKDIKPDVKQQIDRINKAIDADPRKAEYIKAELPLRFPVEIRQYNLESMGGVYFNPNLPKGARTSGEEAITHDTTWRSQKHPTRYPLIYIEIGPLALNFTDETIRSVLWHEFQHYKRYVEFRKPEDTKQPETKQLEAESLDDSSKKKPSMEIEATSIQLVSDFDRLNDDEVKNVLRYLAEFMGNSNTIAAFRSQAIERIKASVTGNRKKQERMLRLIQNPGSKSAEKDLRDLATAITKDLAPKPAKPRHK